MRDYIVYYKVNGTEEHSCWVEAKDPIEAFEKFTRAVQEEKDDIIMVRIVERSSKNS